jgi:hypothetical protein
VSLWGRVRVEVAFHPCVHLCGSYVLTAKAAVLNLRTRIGPTPPSTHDGSSGGTELRFLPSAAPPRRGQVKGAKLEATPARCTLQARYAEELRHVRRSGSVQREERRGRAAHAEHRGVSPSAHAFPTPIA